MSPAVRMQYRKASLAQLRVSMGVVQIFSQVAHIQAEAGTHKCHLRVARFDCLESYFCLSNKIINDADRLFLGASS